MRRIDRETGVAHRRTGTCAAKACRVTARLREMEETAEWHDGRWPSSEEAPMGGRLSLESRFPSFEEAIDVADEMRQRRHARGKTLAMRAIAALLIVAAICIGGFRRCCSIGRRVICRERR